MYIWLRWVFVAARGLLSCCGERGPLLAGRAGLSPWWPLPSQSTGSRRAGPSSHGLRALERRLNSCGTQASVVVACGLQSTGSVVVAHGLSRSAACGIFPDQDSNPCPMNLQVDSQPLYHQGRPYHLILNFQSTT